jgi:hypothetical protein
VLLKILGKDGMKNLYFLKRWLVGVGAMMKNEK